MAIEISEKLQIEAPIDAVWRFVIDPEKVVTCMPGAELVEKLDERTYVGRVKVKLGAITTAYEGKVTFASVDEANYSIQIQGEGRETGGGTAKGTVELQLSALPEGPTEMRTDAQVDLTGKVMQVGRGMIKGVSHQLFQQFAAKAKQKIKASDDSGQETLPTQTQTQTQEDATLRILPVLWQTLLTAIKRLFGQLLGRNSD